jgi:hypothetical protein
MTDAGQPLGLADVGQLEWLKAVCPDAQNPTHRPVPFSALNRPNPSNRMNTQRESRRMVAKFLHIPDSAAVYVIWAAWIAVVIIIGIIVMLWR